MSLEDLRRMNRLKAMMLLDQCTGVDIWSKETCEAQGVPAEWVDELCDCYESGFESDRDTIYHEDRAINQYEGVHDLLLARKIGRLLRVDVERIEATSFGREHEVQAIKEAVADG